MTDTITLPREVVKLALEALEWSWGGEPMGTKEREAITALRAALAAPKQEPVAWIRKEWSPDCGSYFDFCAEEEMGWRDRKEWTPLYATPPATHPGYVIGSHWLETAYSRICAGEAEADVLRDCGWERVDQALRRDAERYRWLRENTRVWPSNKAVWEGNQIGAAAIWIKQSVDWVDDASIDAAIDAEMEASTAPASAAADSSTAPEDKP